MSDFFEEQFEKVILDIQSKFSEDNNVLETEVDHQKKRKEFIERNSFEKEKKDMWND